MATITNRGETKMGFETAYGDGQETNTSLISRALSTTMEGFVEKIETGIRRKGLANELNSTVAGNTGGTVVLEGNLHYEDNILLNQVLLSSFLDGITAGKEYRIRDVQGWNGTTNVAISSSAIYEMMPDVAATACNIALGSTMESLVITGESGGLIKYTANYRSKSVVKGSAETFIGAAPTILTDNCFNYALFAFTGGSHTTAINSPLNFTLTITNIFADDSINHKNSASKLQDLVIGTTVMLDVTLQKLATDYVEFDALILDDTTKAFTLTLTNGDGDEWAITLKGKVVTTTDAPDNNNIITTTLNIEGGSNRDDTDEVFAFLCELTPSE